MVLLTERSAPRHTSTVAVSESVRPSLPVMVPVLVNDWQVPGWVTCHSTLYSLDC